MNCFGALGVRPGAPLPHMQAWRTGSDNSFCIASEQFRLNRLVFPWIIENTEKQSPTLRVFQPSLAFTRLPWASSTLIASHLGLLQSTAGWKAFFSWIYPSEWLWIPTSLFWVTFAIMQCNTTTCLLKAFWRSNCSFSIVSSKLIAIMISQLERFYSFLHFWQAGAADPDASDVHHMLEGPSVPFTSSPPCSARSWRLQAQPRRRLPAACRHQAAAAYSASGLAVSWGDLVLWMSK